MQVLSVEQATHHQLAHETTVDQLTHGFLTRRDVGEQHPVEDFLFTYYSLRPARLRRWLPGIGTAVEVTETMTVNDIPPGHHIIDLPAKTHSTYPSGKAWTLDVEQFWERRGAAVTHLHQLLTATAQRPASWGCFGLHEWAMVYGHNPTEVRHSRWPLRLGPAGTDAVVRSQQIKCTHYDAFRFFTPQAAPLNHQQLSRATQPETEQPGCLHANMDVYKWAYKLRPATPSSLLLECFMLARDIRELDMRASPYDLRDLGYTPVPIETPEGKAEYVAAQRVLAERTVPLRHKLIDLCATLEREHHGP